MANMTFTVRISPQDHELLTSLAAIRNQSVAELSREILAHGIRQLLDPVEIDKRLNAERTRLLEAAARIRAEVADLPAGPVQAPDLEATPAPKSVKASPARAAHAAPKPAPLHTRVVE
ncbi:hypothetical protein NONI108955_36775 [Nocardia ninae]|uniref:Uncharacterized protein n=1 Tax=Nocardia ninae NBRC 108245 TaxID=1210091 RepID=A0A511MDA6_9NOCA|nr:hypothetical protein [Nocardia ninae]GEM38653.1 hypothetical protein NN4_31720 [Nocardia ninae NBRC 108245]